MKKFIIPMVLFISMTNMNAQLGYTKAEIIEKHGPSFEEKETDDKTPYIIYEKEFETKASGKFIRRSCYYLIEDDDKELTCFLSRVFEPSSEINNWVRYFNDSGYVNINELKWKNYESNAVYELKIDKGVCILITYYD